MKIISNYRASTILYFFLVSNSKKVKKWIIPVNICHFVPLCFIKANVPFEFVDVNIKTLDIDKNLILKKLNQNKNEYEGILIVRNYGNDNYDAEFFNKILNISSDLIIIDDACLSFPYLDSYSRNSALTLFSTGYSKPIDLGYGAFAILDAKYSYKEFDLFFNESELKSLNKQIISSIDSKIKLDKIKENSNWLKSENICFDEFSVKIKDVIDKIRIHKNRINDVYFNNINPSFFETRLSSNWRFNLKVVNKDTVLNKIFENGLFASSHYYPLNKLFNNQKCFIWENEYYKIINLFNDFRYSENDAERTCQIINKYAK